MRNLIILIALVIFPASAMAYTHGPRVYRTGAFGGTTLEHTYPCRVDSSSRVASYCDLNNVWGDCYSMSEDCPAGWSGDGYCDPGCVNANGDDGGDCAYSSAGHYCHGSASSGIGSAETGGDRLGNSMYVFDYWFYSTYSYGESTLEYKYDNVIDQDGDCDFTYGVEGVCHQHANRGFWFSAEMPEVSDYDVAGSTLSSIYGTVGGGFGDCRSQEGI